MLWVCHCGPSHVGAGLLESVYAECMALEFTRPGVSFEAQVAVPVIYKGITIPTGFRTDVVVEKSIILEIRRRPSSRP